VVVNGKGDRIMELDDLGSRLDRLISAVEAQTNTLSRLVRVLEPKTKKHDGAANVRMRRAPLDRPIVVTPIVQAAVKRALAKLNR
jgi:hypothetical protein